MCPLDLNQVLTLSFSVKLYNQRDSNPKLIPKQKLAQRVEAENNLSRLHQREVGQDRNIINYDQVYDPRSAHQVDGPFQPAKDPIEIASAGEVETIRPGPKATSIPKERLQSLLDPNGESHRALNYDSGGKEVDMAIQRRVEQIIGLDHQENSIQRVSDKK
jgi:hypothetical protein